MVLSSPVTLYDYPEVAPESAGDLFDSTEIDEMLALRVMTLTDEEKREARGTDARAAAIIDRCDVMPDEVFERLHGAVRYLRGRGRRPTDRADETRGPGGAGRGTQALVGPWRRRLGRTRSRTGSGSGRWRWAGAPSVRLRPTRRADAHDLFLAGRDGDRAGGAPGRRRRHPPGRHRLRRPGASTQLGHGRYLYFYPDEVEPVAPNDRRHDT